MAKHNKKRPYPEQWIIKFLLILATFEIAKGQNPHDFLPLLHVLL
ncbi:MAG TPA: hypothetical protein VK667_02205 [Ktedonobacteraceae bacterium]|nr:hypothetical protein [Ktedonobacteraceae bacterium]